jgi:hypothetical protein
MVSKDNIMKSSHRRFSFLIVLFLGTLLHLLFYKLYEIQSKPDVASLDFDQPTLRAVPDSSQRQGSQKVLGPSTTTASSNLTSRRSSTSRKRARKNKNDASSSSSSSSIRSSAIATSDPHQPIICYVSQGHAKMYGRIKERLEFASDERGTYRLYFHSYDKDCEGCLFQYHTTPAEGRNIAVHAAVTSPDWDKCRYLVVFDDDAYLLHDNSTAKELSNVPRHDDAATRNAWRDLHSMLLSNTTTYQIISPQTPFDFTFRETHHTYQSCIDEVFWMIRRDVVDFVYPFSNLGGSNFWMTNVAMFYIMETCFPAGIWVDYRWKVHNPKHRYGTYRSNYWNLTWQKESLTAIFDRDYNFDFLGPWQLKRPDRQGYKKSNSTLLIHRCRVELSPPAGIDPRCKARSQERFQKWLSGDYIP